MKLARKAVGTAEWTVKERTQARNNAYTSHSTLFNMAKKGELSSSLFKDLNDAETKLRELEILRNESEAQLEAAQQRHTARSATFQQAKCNCENSGCPESHDANPEIPDTSKEEHMARKAAKEEQQRGWQQQSDARWSEARKERNKSSANASDQSEEPKPSSREQTGKPSTGDGQKGTSNGQPKEKPQRKEKPQPKEKPHPVPQPKSSPTRAAAKPATYKEWILTAQQAFRDYTSLSSFPSPPARPCPKPSCMNEGQNRSRALTACVCNIRKGLQFLSVAQLKDLRLIFHPDKFSKCRVDRVELFKKQASEVFVVVDAMYRERKR